MTEKAEAPSVGIVKKIGQILFSLMIIGIGILAFKHPNALNDFEPHYFGSRFWAAFILLIFFLAIKLLWGKIGGGLAIAVGSWIIARIVLPRKEKALSSNTANSSESKNSENASKFRQALLHAGLNYTRQLRNRQQ